MEALIGALPALALIVVALAAIAILEWSDGLPDEGDGRHRLV